MERRQAVVKYIPHLTLLLKTDHILSSFHTLGKIQSGKYNGVKHRSCSRAPQDRGKHHLWLRFFSRGVLICIFQGGNAAYHNFNNDFAHIQDPNERRRLALAEIDKAPFGW